MTNLLNNLSFSIARFLLSGTVLAVGLMGCSGETTVREVQAHPQRNWFNSTVYLRGQVGDRAPLIDAQVYELQDSTGKIWVLTDKATPKTGDRVYIRGQVKFEKIQEEGLEFGEAYIEEQEQLDPNQK
jgi:hypothetical protein